MQQIKQKCAAGSAGSKSTGKRKVAVGTVWESNNCGEFEVIAYNCARDVTVRFVDTGFVTNTQADNVRRGKVKDLALPTACGVGFIGIGEFKPKSGGKMTKHYHAWRNMLKRCYYPEYHALNPTYNGCAVCKEWHNFQNFSRWYYENCPKDGFSYQLDKDLKVIGNKIYSPETCLFVSSVVNSFTIDSGASRGEYMIGVYFNKASGNFQSWCNNPLTKRKEYLGRHNNEINAHMAWRKRKSELAYDLAMIQDRDEVKQALINWKRALDNFEIHGIE